MTICRLQGYFYIYQYVDQMRGSVVEPLEIFWAEYMKYRVELRGYDFAMVEDILRYSSERYVDYE